MPAYQTKRMKDEVRQLMQLTRPPRMEGAVKEAMMRPVLKPKVEVAKSSRPVKMQGMSAKQRKDYHLKSD